jgi:hypothetical protein
MVVNSLDLNTTSACDRPANASKYPEKNINLSFLPTDVSKRQKEG